MSLVPFGEHVFEAGEDRGGQETMGGLITWFLLLPAGRETMTCLGISGMFSLQVGVVAVFVGAFQHSWSRRCSIFFLFCVSKSWCFSFGRNGGWSVESVRVGHL